MVIQHKMMLKSYTYTSYIKQTQQIAYVCVFVYVKEREREKNNNQRKEGMRADHGRGKRKGSLESGGWKKTGERDIIIF